jgi:hypothetical protein
VRAYKHDQTPQTTIDYIQCDLCKQRLPMDKGRRYPDTAEVCCYDSRGLTEAQIADGEHKLVSFDICPPCFFDRIVPLLSSQGATPSYDILSATGARIER